MDPNENPTAHISSVVVELCVFVLSELKILVLSRQAQDVSERSSYDCILAFRIERSGVEVSTLGRIGHE